MARPKIGVFGALFALGGVLAWRWARKRSAAQSSLSRDLTRWEGEGGAVTESTQVAAPSPVFGGAHLRGGNGADPGSSGDAWPFPRS